MAVFSAIRSMTLVALSASLSAVAADEFLKAKLALSQSVSRRDVEQLLLSELIGETAEVRDIRLELQPMYAALPKSAQGTLEPATVRYALHRYFVQKHGWSIAGVDSAGESWNTSSSPAPIMKARAPAFILNLFEQRLNGHLGLHELAAFAATLSSLIRAEAVGKLELVYQGMGLPLDGSLGDEDAATALKNYLVIHLMADGQMGRNGKEFEALEAQLRELYLDYPDTLMWFNDLQESHALEQKPRRNPFVEHLSSFGKSSDFLQEFMHQFGPYQNQECHKLKSLLVDMEQGGSGRVPLSRFYSDALKYAEDTQNGWHFRESVDYLRNLGALDETIPNAPSVVIPNYLQSEGNCLRPSSFYSVCCMSECEGLLSFLERNVAAPSAEHSRIVELVSELPSDTVDAPRNLSAPLLARLNSVAEFHGGRIPLHGRLFAQWMHHAYPRECPFPQVSGTTTPMSPDDWLAKKGHPDASKQQMQMYVRSPDEESMQPAPQADTLPWTHVEELVSVHAHASEVPKRLGGRLLSAVVAFLALASFALPVLRTAAAAAKPVYKADKFLV